LRGKKKFSDEFFLSSSLKKSNRAAVKLSRRGEMRSEARERERRETFETIRDVIDDAFQRKREEKDARER
jgi:hypothetical protein